jgi:hypothetical protein
MEQISLVTFSNPSDEEPDDATTVPEEPTADAANNAKTSPDEKVASEHLMVTCITPSFFKQYSRTFLTHKFSIVSDISSEERLLEGIWSSCICVDGIPCASDRKGEGFQT